MTLDQLLTARDAAGALYQTAVDRLYQAYVQLAALDAALANSNLNDRHADIKTFAPLADNLAQFAHPVYAPLKLPGDWRDEVAARRDDLIAGRGSKQYMDQSRSYLPEATT